MVRTVYLFLCIILFSLFSCQNLQKVKDKLNQKLEKFDKNSISTDFSNKLYILEGIYHTKKNFILTQPKLETHSSSKIYDYLYLNKNGKMSFFTSFANLKNGQIQNSDSFNAVLNNVDNYFVIFRVQTFHRIKGFEPRYGIYKQYLKIKDNKLFIQSNNHCSVYVAVE